jgi:CRISPR/Cas system-associated protein Cas10 (large subunit of type III CRISPR-Cas system)
MVVIIFIDIRINSMDIRDICPYSLRTSSHRLSSKKEIQSFYIIKENKNDRDTRPQVKRYKSCGPGGATCPICGRIRTRALFRAMEKIVGEKGKKAVYYV